MNIIMLGAPGTGKGTQAKLAAEKYGLLQISTGDLFREEISNKTALGEKVTKVMDSGGLVPDDIVFEIFEKRVSQPDCDGGVILDGFPRTLNQAKELENLFSRLNKNLDKIIYIRLSEEEITKRLAGRWTCQDHGHIYHEIFNPPKKAGICDVDQSPLYQRDDQKPEAIAERLVVFRQNTLPMIEYFSAGKNFYEINGDQTVENVFNDITLVVEG